MAITDLSSLAKFHICGEDAFSFLNHVTSGRIPKRIGRTTLTHVLTPAAKVYAEFTVTKIQEQMFQVVTGSGVESHDLRYLEMVSKHGWFLGW